MDLEKMKEFLRLSEQDPTIAAGAFPEQVKTLPALPSPSDPITGEALPFPKFQSTPIESPITGQPQPTELKDKASLDKVELLKPPQIQISKPSSEAAVPTKLSLPITQGAVSENKEDPLQAAIRQKDTMDFISNMMKSSELLGGGIAGALGGPGAKPTAPMLERFADILAAQGAEGIKDVKSRQEYEKSKLDLEAAQMAGSMNRLKMASIQQQADPTSDVSQMARTLLVDGYKRIGLTPPKGTSNMSAYEIMNSPILEKYFKDIASLEEAKAKRISAQAAKEQINQFRQERLEESQRKSASSYTEHLENRLKGQQDLLNRADMSLQAISTGNVTPQTFEDAQNAFNSIITGRIAVPITQADRMHYDTLSNKLNRFKQQFGSFNDVRQKDPALYKQVADTLKDARDNLAQMKTTRELELLYKDQAAGKGNKFREAVTQTRSDEAISNLPISFQSKVKELEEKYPDIDRLHIAYKLLQESKKGEK